jgi:hypothetical protein
MDLYRSMAFLISQPGIALLAGLLLLVAARLAATGTGTACAVLWLLYGVYEYGMKFRLLCSGECNIRIDLLVIYPVLLVAAILASVAVTLAVAKRFRA